MAQYAMPPGIVAGSGDVLRFSIAGQMAQGKDSGNPSSRNTHSNLQEVPDEAKTSVVSIAAETLKPDKENAPSVAAEQGVKLAYETSQLRKDDTANGPASAMSKWGNPAHEAIVREIGCALTLGDEADLDGLSIVLMARASEKERADFAFAFLRRLPPEVADMIYQASCDGYDADPISTEAMRTAAVEYRAARDRGAA